MMMVTILVPVYNTAPYLRQCVGSLVGQTYPDLQIVIIDDGSSDDSLAIMQELANEDKRIEIYSQPNCGVAATRKRLLDKVRGDFVLFVDSDDWIELDTIESLMTEQEKGDFDIVSFQLTIPRKDEQLTREVAVKRFLEHRTFRGSLCDKLVKAKFYEGLKIDQTVSYGEDAMMIWQVLQRVNSVKVLGRVFYHYRENENSLSRQQFNGKKFTAYSAWDMICQDVDETWPQYSDMAHARFACEMAQILRAAALSGYKYNNYVKLLQEEVRRDGFKITRTGVSSWKMRLFAGLISRNYWLANRLLMFVK